MRVKELTEKYECLRSERDKYSSDWGALAALFLPGRFRAEGRDRASDATLLNSAGVLAMRTLASGLHGGMTSPTRPWFSLGYRSPERCGEAEKLWLAETERRMQAALARSNFYNAVHALYADLATFGTALMIATADADGLDFCLVRAGEYVLDCDAKGKINTFFRRVPLNARQIGERFGRLPRSLHGARKSPERFEVIHGVFPHGEGFCGVYFLPGCQDGLLEEGFFAEFPAFAPRWDAGSGDIYGRSPAMDVLADAKMLQAMTKSLRVMQHKIAQPPLLVDHSLRGVGIDLTPDAVNFVDAKAASSAVSPVRQPDSQALGLTAQSIKDCEETVRAGLYNNLFRYLEGMQGMTAEEVRARQAENLLLAGPVVERLVKELLDPAVRRTFSLMRAWGEIPPFPQGLEQDIVEASFSSVLSPAQKALSAEPLERAADFAARLAAVFPNAMQESQAFDPQAMFRAYCQKVGASW